MVSGMDTRMKMHDDNPKVKRDSKHSEGDENSCDGGVDGPHASAKPGSEGEEGNLEHERKAFNEEVEGPRLEPIALALVVSATLDHRPTRIPQVAVKPLFSQHRNKCGE